MYESKVSGRRSNSSLGSSLRSGERQLRLQHQLERERRLADACLAGNLCDSRGIPGRRELPRKGAHAGRKGENVVDRPSAAGASLVLSGGLCEAKAAIKGERQTVRQRKSGHMPQRIPHPVHSKQVCLRAARGGGRR